MAEYAEGEVVGFVVVTWNQASGWPTLDDNAGELYDNRQDAEEQAARMTAETAAVGRGETHRALPVISVEEAVDA